MLTRKTIAAAVLCTALVACKTTFDKAYESAQVYGPEKPDGVVLFLHGCGGANVSGEHVQWMKFFNEQNWLMVVPDSFADSRPPRSCKPPWFDKDRIYMLRKNQAKHAIARVREDYPGLNLVVWGHSEGAASSTCSMTRSMAS